MCLLNLDELAPNLLTTKNIWGVLGIIRNTLGEDVGVHLERLLDNAFNAQAGLTPKSLADKDALSGLMPGLRI